MRSSSFPQCHSQFSARYGMFPLRRRLLAMHSSSFSLRHSQFPVCLGCFPQRHRLRAMRDRIPTNVGCKVTT